LRGDGEPIFIALDFSSRSKPALGRNTIWLGLSSSLQPDSSFTANFSTRASALNYLLTLFEENELTHQQIHLGVDFGTALPSRITEALCDSGSSSDLHEPWHLWDQISDLITDHNDNSNNRFEVAAYLNRSIGEHYFWGLSTPKPTLPPPLQSWILPLSPKRTGDQLRICERIAQRQARSRISSTAQLYGAGAVGSQTLLGMAFLSKLTRAIDHRFNLWPFHLNGHRITLYEIWPRLLVGPQAANSSMAFSCNDEYQVVISAAWMRMRDGLTTAQGKTILERTPEIGARLRREGWILGTNAHNVSLDDTDP
ncbi:MAG: hypothetical protein ACP5O0_08285, partial [Acidimicrobiales bacterium]